MSKETVFELLKILSSSLEEKQILLNFRDENLQEKVKEYRGDGRVIDTKYDYLQIVNSNIAGQKSDREIKNQYLLKSELASDGSIVNTLVIKRVHTGVERTRFTGVRNVNWLRVYVPEGSELLEVKGFEVPDEKFFETAGEDWLTDPDLLSGEGMAMTHQISKTKVYHELGKTVFANWSMVDPGETARIEIKYKLPFKISQDIKNGEKAHMLTWQKQAGDTNTEIKLQYIFPENYEVFEKGGEEDCFSAGCALNTDKYWYYIFK